VVTMYLTPMALVTALIPATATDFFWVGMASFTLITAFGALLRVLPRKEE
jgi:hypothetical protein